MSSLRVVAARPLPRRLPATIPFSLLLGSLLLLASVLAACDGEPPAASSGATAAAADTRDGREGRFTLRLGQGFRFADGAIVDADAQSADIGFKFLPPKVGGLSTRYNEVSQQVEVGFEPTLTASMPLILSPHIGAFDAKPDVARITSGDIASYPHQAPITTTTRYLLLMNAAGDQYLLTLDELVAPEEQYDHWQISFVYEPVRLPLGAAGGPVNPSLPGRLVFRDWYRTKMIMSVDLTTGREETIADGMLPSTLGDRLLAYADSSGAYILRDASGRVLHTVRFNEQVLGPVLSPDGARLVGSVYRPGPDQVIGGTVLPGPPVLATAVFDLAGRELVAVPNYDDASWTPDGKLIATGALFGPGLFEIDPETSAVRPIAPQLENPSSTSVSPDGRTIAFVMGGKVWLIERDGQNLRQLFPHGLLQQRPAFSPDGTRIAFIICNTMASDATGEVFVIDLETREVTPIRTVTGMALVPDPYTRLNWIS
jgi:hypothetical protein